jgi:hypothetical protein
MLRWDLANFLPRLASNHNPPTLHLPHSWNCKHVTPVLVLSCGGSLLCVL